jgi:hypothetical protein
VLPGEGEPCQLCVGSSSDVGSCDVRSVVRLAFLLPVSDSVAPDVHANNAELTQHEHFLSL